MTVRIIVGVCPNTNSANAAANAIRDLKKSDQIDFSLKAGVMFRKDERGCAARSDPV